MQTVKLSRKSEFQDLSVISKINAVLEYSTFRIFFENWQFGECHFQVSKAGEGKPLDDTWKRAESGKTFSCQSKQMFLCSPLEYLFSVHLSMAMIQTVESKKVPVSVRWNNVQQKAKGEYVGEACGVMQKIMGNFLWGWAVECSPACTWE